MLSTRTPQNTGGKCRCSQHEPYKTREVNAGALNTNPTKHLFLNVISELILHLWKHQLYVKKIPENVEFPFIVIVCLSKMTNYTLSVKGQSLSI